MEGGTGPKRVFIVGFPRSGTTWTMWLLAQHPSVVVLQQSGLFHALQPLEEWWRQDHRVSRAPTAEERGEGRAYGMGSTAELLAPADLHRTLRPLVDHVFERSAAGRPGTSAVVEQTPENLEFAELVRGVMPEAFFLHVVRDPRAACCSMRSAAYAWADFPVSTTQIANRWRDYASRARRLREVAGERYHEVRYEDLEANGPRELERIHRWLGLDTSPGACAAAVEACGIERLRKSTRMPSGFYRRGTSQAWRDEITRAQLRVFEHVARDEMERWGYAPLLPPDGKPWRVRAYDRLARLVVRFDQGRGRLRRPRRALQRLVKTLRFMHYDV